MTANIGTAIRQVSKSTIVFGVENSTQNLGEFLFRFSLGSYVMDQRSGDGRSVDELKSSRSIEGKDFPIFEMLDAKIASAQNKIIQNSHFK